MTGYEIMARSRLSGGAFLAERHVLGAPYDDYDDGAVKVKRLRKYYDSIGRPRQYAAAVEKLWAEYERLDAQVPADESQVPAALARRMKTLGAQASAMSAQIHNERQQKSPAAVKAAVDAGVPPDMAPPPTPVEVTAEDLAWAAANTPDMSVRRGPPAGSQPQPESGGFSIWGYGLALLGLVAVGRYVVYPAIQSSRARGRVLRAARGTRIAPPAPPPLPPMRHEETALTPRPRRITDKTLIVPAPRPAPKLIFPTPPQQQGQRPTPPLYDLVEDSPDLTDSHVHVSDIEEEIRRKKERGGDWSVEFRKPPKDKK